MRGHTLDRMTALDWIGNSSSLVGVASWDHDDADLEYFSLTSQATGVARQGADDASIAWLFLNGIATSHH